MQSLSIIGSTGSVGQKVVNLVQKSLKEYRVELLVCASNAKLLAEQAIKTNCNHVCIMDENSFPLLKNLLNGFPVKTYCGLEALNELVEKKVNRAFNCVSGFAGFMVTLKIIESGTKLIALANKESVICGGNLLMDLIRKKNISVIPVDSEHNSIFRVLEHRMQDAVKLTITASGGPFLKYKPDDFKNITAEQATNHPTWKMGKKISVDSATMANKAIEVIEAHYLFSGINIEVLVHPESIVHGVVHYCDGTMTTVMHDPDMSFPISHALYWPEECPLPGTSQTTLRNLTFMKPDFTIFPILKLGFDIIASKYTHADSVIFNAANEIAVDAFLNNKIPFSAIVEIVMESLTRIRYRDLSMSQSDIFELDIESRAISNEVLVQKKCNLYA